MEKIEQKNETEGTHLLRGTLVIIAVSFLAKISAFLTDTILAYFLGTTYQSDAYYMVSGVQQVIYPMLSVGIWKVFLPIYKARIAEKKSHVANSFANITLSVFTVASAVLASILFFFSGAVVSVIAPGFSGETKALCEKLVKISSPMYVFIIASAVYAAMLQCHHQFFGSQIREVASHIPVILAAVLLYRRFGVEILAYALVAGSILRLLVELPFVNWGYKFGLSFEEAKGDFRLLLTRLPAAVLTSGIDKINTLADQIMASGLAIGALSTLTYGQKLIHVFSGLFSSAISTAFYPQMIEMITQNKKEKLNALLTKIINIFVSMMIPITLASILFRVEIVSFVFERGAFSKASVGLTAKVFAIYSITLLFSACNTIIDNVFFGNGDTKTPMRISMMNVTIKVLLNLLLVRIFGVEGLAISTAVTSILVFVLRVIESRKYVSINIRHVVSVLLKATAVALAACGLALVFVNWIEYPVFLELIAAGVIGVAVYIPCMYVLKVSEIQDVFMIVKKKLGK